MKLHFKILPFLVLGCTQVAFAQIKEEKLVLDRKREPEVKKIEKKKTSVEIQKNYPPDEKSAHPPKYDIVDVPAASDFKTSLIQGEDISPRFDADYQNNYFRFGMGNYGRILADGNVSTKLEDDLEAGADFHLINTTGLKKEYPWSSAAREGNVAAYLNSYGENGKLNVNADFGLRDYNYYGIYAFTPNSVDLDLQQKVTRVAVEGYYDFYSNEILNDVRLKSNLLADRYGSKELAAAAAVNLSKHGVDIAITDGVRLNADLGLNVETVKSDFDILNKYSSQHLNLTAGPKLTFFQDQSYLMIGSDFSFLNSKYNSQQALEPEQKNKTYWFPKAEIQIAATEEFKFYGGVTGGLHLNSFSELLDDNPYLLADQQLRPTETKYKFYVGLRGDVDQEIKYDVRGGFGKLNDILFYRANDLLTFGVNADRPPYDFANTFSAVYDDGTLSEVEGRFTYFPLANLSFEAGLHFQQYKLDNQKDILNKPLLTGSVGGKYLLLNKKLQLGARAIFRSALTTNSFQVDNSGINPDLFVSTENAADTVSAFADLNLSAEFKVHKNFSIFALGNNLLNTRYEMFKGYKVLGAQVMGGVKISF